MPIIETIGPVMQENSTELQASPATYHVTLLSKLTAWYCTPANHHSGGGGMGIWSSRSSLDTCNFKVSMANIRNV